MTPTNAASAAGLAVSAEMIAVTMSRTSPRSSSVKLVSRSSATRKAPPMIGTASSSLRLDSATNWMMTSCQLAAASSAPRLSAALSPGIWVIDGTVEGARGKTHSIASGWSDLWRFDRDGILRSGAFDFPQTDHAHPARQHGSARRRRADRRAADGGLRRGRGMVAVRVHRCRRDVADRASGPPRAGLHDGSRAGRRAHGGERSDRATEHGAERRGSSARVVRRRGARAQSIAGRSAPARRHDLRLVGRRACLGRSPVGPPPGADQRGRGPVRDAVAARAAPRLHPAHRRSRAQRAARIRGRRARDHACARDTGAQRGLAQLPDAHLDRAGLAAAAGRRRGRSADQRRLHRGRT